MFNNNHNTSDNLTLFELSVSNIVHNACTIIGYVHTHSLKERGRGGVGGKGLFSM